MKLKEIITFKNGPNATRVNKKLSGINFYTINDLNEDICNFNLSLIVKSIMSMDKDFYNLNAGDVVISILKEKASIIGNNNTDKIINSSFIKCYFDYKKLYPGYFCYYINESDEFKKQKNNRTGYMGLRYLHITIDSLNECEIDLPKYEIQKKVGDIYMMYCRLRFLQEHKKQIIDSMILNTIQNISKEK